MESRGALEKEKKAAMKQVVVFFYARMHRRTAKSSTPENGRKGGCLWQKSW